MDAAYCAIAAVLLLGFADPLAKALSAPSPLVVAAAVGTAMWALLLSAVAYRADLRPWLVRVLAANLVAACLVAALAVVRPFDGLSVLLIAVSVEVATFAAVQAIAVRRRAA